MSPVTRTGTPPCARILVVAALAVATALILVAPQASFAASKAPSVAAMTQRVIDDTNARHRHRHPRRC